MTNNVIDAPMDNGSLAIPGQGERRILLLLLTQVLRNIQTHAQEEGAIDAEDILTQAEEANAIEPVG